MHLIFLEEQKALEVNVTELLALSQLCLSPPLSHNLCQGQLSNRDALAGPPCASEGAAIHLRQTKETTGKQTS